MAKGWVLLASIVRSEKVRGLYADIPLDPIRVFCILIARVNQWGVLPGDPYTLKAELGPEDPYHGPKEFKAAVDALVEAKLVSRWQHQGTTYIYLVGHLEANKNYLRKLKGLPGIPMPENVEDGGDLAPGASVAPVFRQPGAPSLQVGRQRGAYEVKEEVKEGEGIHPLPPPQKSEDRTEGPDLNPDPTPVDKADHGGRPPRTSPQVSPSLADQPSLAPGVEPDGLPGSPRGSEKRIMVDDQTRNTPGRRSAPPPQQSTAQESAKSSCGSRGDLPSRLSEVLPAVMSPFKADSNELVEVQELQQYFANVWGAEISPVLPRGDNLARVLEVLRHPAGGWDVCRAAIRGHHKIASRDGAQHGREFRLVFPPLRIGGKQQTARVDLDRVFEYARKGRKPQPRQEDKPKEPEITREEAEAAAKKGIAQVRKAINQNGENPNAR